MIEVLHHFVPALLAGFLIYLEVAFGAVAIGLAVGQPTALLRHRFPWSRRIVWPCVRLMQAAPTYAVMFFALSALPRDLVVLDRPVTGLTAVMLAQAVYMIAYVAENFFRALQHLDRHEREHALLFLPNLLRGFVVVVMSSGFGAAIGVSEAVGVTMQQAELLHAAGDRVVLFVLVITFFVALFGGANTLIRYLVRRLSVKMKSPP